MNLGTYIFSWLPSLIFLLPILPSQELEVKKKAEEEMKAEDEAKAKEVELNASEGRESGSDPELLQVKVRLDKLEETLKEIVVESKKQDSTSTKNQEDGSGKKHHTATDLTSSSNSSEASNSTGKDHFSKQKPENVAQNATPENVSGSAAPMSDVFQRNL